MVELSPSVAAGGGASRIDAVQGAALRGGVSSWCATTCRCQATRLRVRRSRTLADWGGYGVDIFFVISGFIITYSVLRRPTFSTRRFLLDRVDRIYPVYWVLLAATVLLSLALTAAGGRAGHGGPADARGVRGVGPPAAPALSDHSHRLDPGDRADLLPRLRARVSGGRPARRGGRGRVVGRGLHPLQRGGSAARRGALRVRPRPHRVGVPLRHRHRLAPPPGHDAVRGARRSRSASCGRRCWCPAGPVSATPTGRAGLAAGIPAAALVYGAVAAPFRVPGWIVLCGGASYALYLSHSLTLALGARAGAPAHRPVDPDLDPGPGRRRGGCDRRVDRDLPGRGAAAAGASSADAAGGRS